MTIIQLSSISQYEDFLKSNRYSIVSYTTVWCPACIKIMPSFDNLSNKYTDIQFLNADLNKLGSLTIRENINAMPTFIIFKNGMKVKRLEATNTSGIETALNLISNLKS
jgi:thioredoxin 1